MTISIEKIVCTNNRSVNNDSIKALAENIKAVGLLSPITLCELPDGKYEVVAGRRRFRALVMLETEALTDDQYVILSGSVDHAIVAFSENFHRENLSLAEEVEQLSKLQTGSIADRAAVLGKTSSWVALRMNLANLSKSWKAVLQRPDEFPQWTAAKLEIIAKQPKDAQEAFAVHLCDNINAKHVLAAFEDRHRKISSAVFDTESCQKCKKCAVPGDLLFPELGDDSASGSCLDGECFDRQTVDWAIGEIEKTKASRDANSEPFYLIADGWPRYGTPAYDALESIKQLNRWCSPGKAKGKVPNALYVYGANVGYARISPSGNMVPMGTRAEASATAESGKKIKTLEDREAELQAKRDREAMVALAAHIRKEEEGLATGKGWRMFIQPGESTLFHLVALLGVPVWDNYAVPGATPRFWTFSDVNDFLMVPDDYRNTVLWRHVLLNLADQIDYVQRVTLPQVKADLGRMFCAVFGAQWETYDKIGIFAVPTPKSVLVARSAAQATK